MAYDTRHGGPYDRGSADSYYGRPYAPHYFRGASYSTPRYEKHEMTPGQIEEYAAGYNDGEEDCPELAGDGSNYDF